MLRNARKLKEREAYSKIGLSFDKTKKQQQEFRVLKEELKTRNAATESGMDFVIFRGKITLKGEIPSIIRKGKEAAGTGWSSSNPIGGGGNPGLSPHGNKAGNGLDN